MTIPAELLAIAQATRATFGPGVKLLHVCDEASGQHSGNRVWDDVWLGSAQSPPRSAPIANKADSL